LSTYKSYSDQTLIGLLQTGDKLAYTEIYDRYISSMLDHAYNKCRSKEEAKDAVQEVFTMLWTRRETIHEDQNLGGFLFTSTRNVIINLINRKGIHARYMASVEDFEASGLLITDHLVRENQMRAIIEKEIAALPSKMREIFELSRKEHLSHKEIAKRLDISEQTVSKQVSNALKVLRVKLGVFTYLVFLIYYR
jgi:RNA polymerase sigma-70 factor (family 1)